MYSSNLLLVLFVDLEDIAYRPIYADLVFVIDSSHVLVSFVSFDVSIVVYLTPEVTQVKKPLCFAGVPMMAR